MKDVHEERLVEFDFGDFRVRIADDGHKQKITYTRREGLMAEEKVVTYTCDGCLREMARRELRRFVLEERKMDNALVAAAKFELCTDCEGKLHEVAFPLMPAKQRERLEGIIR